MPLSTLLVVRKPLKLTDTLRRFAIRTKRLPLFPQFNGHYFVRVDFWHGSKPWPMVISIRTHGHKKPVISKGWMPFVRENHLKVGDVVKIFRDEEEAGIRYRIEIERGSNPPRPTPTPAAVPTAHNANFNVEVVANISAIKQETQLAPGNVLLNARTAEELSAHQTHHDDPQTANLNPILNQTSADEFGLNFDLNQEPPVVACEGNQAPTMGLFGTEAENFNPRIVLNLDLTRTTQGKLGAFICLACFVCPHFPDIS